MTPNTQILLSFVPDLMVHTKSTETSHPHAQNPTGDHGSVFYMYIKRGQGQDRWIWSDIKFVTIIRTIEHG